MLDRKHQIICCQDYRRSDPAVDSWPLLCAITLATLGFWWLFG